MDKKNTIQQAAKILLLHRRLLVALTQQGQSEIAAALDNMEEAIKQARIDLGLVGENDG